jgi:hypothetical protein
MSNKGKQMNIKRMKLNELRNRRVNKKRYSISIYPENKEMEEIEKRYVDWFIEQLKKGNRKPLPLSRYIILMATGGADG